MEHAQANTKAFETVVKFLQKNGWKFTRQEEKRLLRMSFRCGNGDYQCIAHVLDQRPIVLFLSVAGLRVPEEKRSAMAEFLTRANYGILIGNFEMDYSDGEVRYKTSVDIRDGQLTADMVKALVDSNIATMDRYFPGMMSVLFGDVSPEAAVAKVEGRSLTLLPWEAGGVRRFG